MKKVLLFILVISVCFIYTGCGRLNDGTEFSEISDSSTLFLVGYNFEGANPLYVKNDTNREIFSLIYEPLFSIDRSFTPVPVLAKSVSMSTSDGINYRIDLNDQVTFHDGTIMTSGDVVATINYLLSNNTTYDYNVKKILNVSKNGDFSVNVTLKEPVLNFAALLTFPIVNAKDILSEFSFNGTGKYKVGSYVSRKYIELVPFENYHSEKNESIKKIKVQLVPDKKTANYAYSSGMADIYSQDIFSEITSSGSKGEAKSLEYLSANYGFMLFNNSLGIFQNANVRKAIDLAIDKETIAKDVLFLKAEVTPTPIFQGAWCYNENVSHKLDIEKAKELLKNEGFTHDPSTGILVKSGYEPLYLTFRILVNSDNNYRIQVANKICENLKYIGIDCGVEVVSFEEYTRRYYMREFQALVGTVPMSYDFDLSKFLGEYNVSGYYNSNVLSIMSKIALTDDMNKKKEYFKELQKIFFYDVPHISLYYTKENVQNSGKIKEGIDPNDYSLYNGIVNWELSK